MTAIPAALDRLVSLLTVGLPNVQVIDGAPIVNLEKTGVCVGYAPDQLSVEMVAEGAGLDSNVENFDVHCLAWASGEDSKTVRDLVFTTVAGVDSLIGNDPSLSRTVTNARLRVVDLDQAQLQTGTWAAAAFVITCKAFT